MNTITGDELFLRDFDIEKDVKNFHKIHSDPNVVKFYGMNPLETIDESIAMISNYIESSQKQKSMHWVICLTTKQEYIGEIGLFNINLQHKRANSYCILSSDYWGQGISKKATLLLFPYIFENTSINRIQAFVDTHNYSTIKSLINIGYVNEGVLTEYEYENGAFIDMSVFAMTRNRFDIIYNKK